MLRFYAAITDANHNALVETNPIVIGLSGGDEWLVEIGKDGGPSALFDSKGVITVHSTQQACSRPEAPAAKCGGEIRHSFTARY